MQNSQSVKYQRADIVNPFEGRVGLVYARVSSKKQETEGSGLQSQDGRCVKDLQSIGVPYLFTFRDSFTGAGDFMNRPAMRELLAYIDAHPQKKFVVVFDDLKRFARDFIFHFKLKDAFRGRDVILRCLNHNFDDSPEGEFAELIFAGQAQLERKQNRRQVIQKTKARLERGYWAFSSKRGYDMVSDSVHGKLATPNKDAEVIRIALEGFASGKFLRQIDVAKYFVERSFWGKSCSPERALNRVKEMLQDPFYCGDIEYLPWEVSRRRGHHQALISCETFERIQGRMKKAVAGTRERLDISDDFPLRGLLLCPGCNKPLTGAWHKKHTYAHYYCQNSKGCPLRHKTLRKKDVEDNFDTLVRRNRLKIKVEPVIQLAFERVWRQEIKALAEQEVRLEQRRKVLKEKVAGLADLAHQAQSEAVRRAYESQIEEATNELDGLEMPLSKADLDVPYRTALGKVMGLFKSPYDVWKSVDVREKHRLFYFLFEARLPYDKKDAYRTGDELSVTRLFEELVASDYDSVDCGSIFWNSFALECNRLVEILKGEKESPIPWGSFARV